eukprot:CAMPEP_0196659290 /NCGR_PEP_ID=MMETSP1086-20130531/34188_1 /TAXON_ID=77921 /ORGANISM="Cyanoptyche  gloeocystis , Strain SAG4.97" /LENGTH=55 /DNA_ID=CAMNT_0041993199 /DNA_START=301 /DNA_END=465 /DNA_ORIENTATION=+
MGLVSSTECEDTQTTPPLGVGVGASGLGGGCATFEISGFSPWAAEEVCGGGGSGG